MSAISFTVPAVPVAQPRVTHGTFGGKKIAFVPSGHTVHAFKATVRMAAREAIVGPPLAGPLGLWLTFVLPRPKRLFFKRRAMPRLRHTSKPDLDNLQKSVKDALKGIAWLDDSQVCEGVYDKVYAAADEAPHVEIEIARLSEALSE